MKKEKIKILKRNRRRARIKAKIKGTKGCPRLSLFKSNKELYLQLIDDIDGKTLISAHSKEIKDVNFDEKDKNNKKEIISRKVNIGHELGKLIAQKAISKKIERVVFDRGGYRYHGRVKAVANGAREGGLKF
jgi:large subunit ribosomal protein L18